MQRTREIVLYTPSRKTTLSACHASYSARMELKPRPTCPDGLPVSAYIAFCRKVLARRDTFERRRKFHNYTYTRYPGTFLGSLRFPLRKTYVWCFPGFFSCLLRTYIQGSPSGCVWSEIPGVTQVDEKGHEGNSSSHSFFYVGGNMVKETAGQEEFLLTTIIHYKH